MKFTPTCVLVIANIAVYLCTSIVGGNAFVTDIKILLFIGQVNPFVMHGWLWQLVTAMFVHVNIVHVASNMLFLFIFGLRAEKFFTYREFCLIYFASGLAGNLLTLLARPYDFYVSAGASGAIFGLFGANTIYLRKILRKHVTNALIYAFIFLMFSVSAGVNLLAHIGGLLVGLAIGYFLAASSKIIKQKNKVIIVR